MSISWQKLLATAADRQAVEVSNPGDQQRGMRAARPARGVHQYAVDAQKLIVEIALVSRPGNSL
jgi:hypothetical protein